MFRQRYEDDDEDVHPDARRRFQMLRKIFLHLRDRPRDNCVVHCAQGKDRTGVAIALILSLAGVPKQEVAEEYALTNTGLEPYRPVVRKVLASMSNLT